MANNRIIVVEDDPSLSEGIAMNLAYVGYEYALFDDGQKARACLEKDHAFDLALLDIMLPGIDGFELFWHFERYNIPVIYMTAKTDSTSEIRGLRDGAEDYIVKPFDVVTLLVRIEKVLARTGKLSKVLTFKDYRIDIDDRTVTRRGEPRALKPLEFDVLVMLAQNKNRTVPRERLLNELWGVDYVGGPRTVDVHIANIRKKLELTTEIVTISKTGYRLEDN